MEEHKHDVKFTVTLPARIVCHECGRQMKAQWWKECAGSTLLVEAIPCKACINKVVKAKLKEVR